MELYRVSKIRLTVDCCPALSVKAAGDKMLVNKFIRQNSGGGLMLKNVIS